MAEKCYFMPYFKEEFVT